LGHESLDVTLGYLKGKDAESEEAQEDANSSSLACTHNSCSNQMLLVERGIVERNVDDVKTDESRKSLVIAD
jgi:hypothetical protein